MTWHDKPVLPSLAESVRRLERDPDLKTVNGKVARFHVVFPDVLRVVWRVEPTQADRNIVPLTAVVEYGTRDGTLEAGIRAA
jgi:hypothetical protein